MEDPPTPDIQPSPPAEERTTEDAAGAPAGDRDLDDLLDDADPASA